jgi:DNA-binding CsgD family transcriptional regulator
MIRTEEEHLAHYGILRRSGRYPWGSGGTESTRNRSYLDTVADLKKKGMSESEIAKGFGITTTQLRAARSIALAQQKQEKILRVQRYKEHGLSNTAIGQRMGLNESSVRALLAPGEKDKADALQTTANMLKGHVDKKGYVDVGRGVDSQLGITQTRLHTALSVLQEQGYAVHNIKVQQLGTGKYTKTKVLARPGTTLSEVQRNRSQIKLIDDFSNDNGRSFFKTQPPISISSKRIKIHYAEDGGGKADGVIFVRPGAKNLSMGADRYGQVRVLVDGTHYLKGMAVYKDDLPEGTDLLFNTKKSNTGRKKDALKPIEDDSELPFGSIVRQIHGPDGKVSSALNFVGSKEGAGSEGDWDTWSRNLSAQVLSKQSPDLAKTQLNVTFQRRTRELAEINSLTNPTVRKKLLLGFADSTDSAAVHLKAASLPRQSTKVLLPISSIKPTEVYARGLRDGERVALVRFPHSGTFEIPELTVNNRNREGRSLLGAASDAIGIHHSVAERLSGADFDGDTVLVIPNNKRLIKSTAALEGLKKFDPMIYKIPKDSPIQRMTSARKGQEMGSVSNLITDMTLHRASTEELARAVRHSMVVIDAEKHELDFLQSEKDNGIRQLKEKYQGSKRAGASTLISRKEATTRIPERVARSASRGGPIDAVTGKKVFEETGRTRPDFKIETDPNTGKRVRVETSKRIPIVDKVPRLSVTEDAHALSSGTVMETIYGEHSNKLKAMANSARKEAVVLRSLPQSKSAKKVYAEEVSTLNAKLNIAKKNAPLERHAQLIANHMVSLRRQANPNMENDEVKKIKQYALNEARSRTGAQKTKISITAREWEAIQAGALSAHKLDDILTNTDLDHIKKLAMPKHISSLSSTELSRAKVMLSSGYTEQEVADHLGIGLTTLKLGLEHG